MSNFKGQFWKDLLPWTKIENKKNIRVGLHMQIQPCVLRRKTLSILYLQMSGRGLLSQLFKKLVNLSSNTT